MSLPSFRLLRGYVLDPGFSTRLDTMGINETVYKVRWEEDLKPGPCGAYFEVMDHDPASGCWYEPVKLDHIHVLAQNGVAPSEGNPKFHQQFIYTIAMKTLDHFEASLGRKIIWAPRVLPPDKKAGRKDWVVQYVPALRLYPHAFRDGNAYYDPEKKAVMFGYFEAARQVQGANLPGGVVFTCLSPDIIAHELTHALLDSIHPRFTENTNPDVAAFHEAFADLVALLQRFTLPTLVEHQLGHTRGDLGAFSFLGELATQVGDALGGHRGALRGAIGGVDPKTGKWKKKMPDPTLYQTEFRPHQRGAILVATIFDAFLRLYQVQTEDLISIATGGTRVLQPGDIHPDLVRRLAREACVIAGHLLHICIRALDYCPPVDISFGEYLRALITADLDVSPEDNQGYRVALIEAFRSWGIFPDRVNTLSVESLRWRPPLGLTGVDETVWKTVVAELRPHLQEIASLSALPEDNREKIHTLSSTLQAQLKIMLEAEKSEQLRKHWGSFLNKLGLTDQKVAYHYGGRVIRSQKVPPIQVHKVRPVFRVGREGRVLDQVLISVSQTFRVSSGPLKGAKFRGGSSIILNLSDQRIVYIIYKNIRSEERFAFQMDYQSGASGQYGVSGDSLSEDDGGFESISFSKLHFH